MKQKMFDPQRKMLWHIPRIAEWFSGGNPPPILVEIDPSNICNHSCNFCTFKYIKNKSLLPFEIIEPMIRDFRKMGVKAITWTGGGEPLCNPDFGKMVEEAGKWKKRKIKQGLFTNGVLIDWHLAKIIIRTHAWIRISIDAGTAETYSKIKGCKQSDWEKVWANLDLLRQAKEETHKSDFIRSNTTIGIGMIITPDNYKEIETFAALGKEHKAGYVQFKPMIQNCFADTQLEKDWWMKEVIPRLNKAEKIYDRCVLNAYKLKDVMHPETSYGRNYEECYGHYFVPCVGATGAVWLCTHMRHIAGFSFGNLKEQSFREIWDSKRRQRVIKRIDFAKCQDCCKLHQVNKLLWEMKNPIEELHPEFI